LKRNNIWGYANRTKRVNITAISHTFLMKRKKKEIWKFKTCDFLQIFITYASYLIFDIFMKIVVSM
jgi:hypothetical protein